MPTLPRWIHKFSMRLRSLSARHRLDEELDDELQFHIDKQIEENLERGMDAAGARHAALVRFGGLTQRKEECRETRGFSLIEQMVTDVRHGLRLCGRQRGFSLTVVTTLALGIGASTAVFSVLYGVVLRPLPYPQPDRLVTLTHGPTFGSVAIGNYLDWRAQNTVFDDVALTKLTQNFNITGDGEPERVLGGRTTPSLFRVLGVQPILGRVFTEADGPVEDKVVLGEALWRRRYASDRTIVGRRVLLNGRPYTVLGVMPESFQYRNSEFALWTPIKFDPNEPRGVTDYAAIARLADRVTLAQAQAQMNEVQARIGEAHPDIRNLRLFLMPMLDAMVAPQRTPLYVLMGAVSCLLLIAGANLANLLMVRSIARSRELVVRTALGANKRRLMLQTIAELLPLMVVGGVGGLGLAYWMLSRLIPLLPATMPRLSAVRLDAPVLAFATMTLLAVTIGAAIWPVLHVRRGHTDRTLRASGRTATAPASRLRNVLVIAEIANVVILLVVSGLLVRSLLALQSVNPGFRTDHILAVHFALSEKYGTNPKFSDYLHNIMERVSTLPGVSSVAVVNRLPLAGQTQTGTLFFEATPLPQDATLGSVNLDWRTATPDYFRTMGIPLVAGRFFNETDTADRPGVGIVDERLARTVWPNQNPIGKRFRFGGGPPWYEVVGVVGHIRHDKLSLDERPQVYWSYRQRVQPRMALAVRTSQDPNLLTAGVLAAIHAVDPDQPVYDVRAMDDVVARSMAQERLTAMLLTIFAAVALVLATVGVYGVLSYSVGLRTREIGIRLALGSQPGEVVRMVLRQGATLAVTGTALGLAGALALGRLVRTLLFDVTPTDLLSFAGAAIAILVVALVASFIPARRAASVQPLSVLRAD
jgi:putative ABC transport system permease protein